MSCPRSGCTEAIINPGTEDPHFILKQGNTLDYHDGFRCTHQSDKVTCTPARADGGGHHSMWLTAGYGQYWMNMPQKEINVVCPGTHVHLEEQGTISCKQKEQQDRPENGITGPVFFERTAQSRIAISRVTNNPNDSFEEIPVVSNRVSTYTDDGAWHNLVDRRDYVISEGCEPVGDPMHPRTELRCNPGEGGWSLNCQISDFTTKAWPRACLAYKNQDHGETTISGSRVEHVTPDTIFHCPTAWMRPASSVPEWAFDHLGIGKDRDTHWECVGGADPEELRP